MTSVERSEDKGPTDRRKKGWQAVCPHPGCKRRGSVADISEHATSCELRLLRCPNPGCFQLVPATQLGMHTENCPYTPVLCSWDGCGQKVPRCDMGQHTEACEHRLVPCPLSGCSHQVKAKALQGHILECIKLRGNITYDGERGRLVVLRGLDFVSDLSPTPSSPQNCATPRFVFRDVQAAERTLDDLAHLLDMTGVVGGDVIVTHEQVSHSWTGQLAGRRQAAFVVEELVARGVPADKMLASVVPAVGGSQTGIHVNVHFGQEVDGQSVADSLWPPSEL